MLNAKAAGWGNTSTVRALTEPTFNNWLGQTLGLAKNIKYVLKKVDVNKKVTKKSFAITSLNMQPLDFFLIPGAEVELQDIIINLYQKSKQ